MWGKKNKNSIKDQNTTTVKQKTVIKETYTIPSSNINPEVNVPTVTSNINNGQIEK